MDDSDINDDMGDKGSGDEGSGDKDNGPIENDNLTLAQQMQERLTWLQNEHRRIDQEIGALTQTGPVDMLKIRRMKKIKLSMKDQISYLENQLTPDIIA